MVMSCLSLDASLRVWQPGNKLGNKVESWLCMAITMLDLLGQICTCVLMSLVGDAYGRSLAPVGATAACRCTMTTPCMPGSDSPVYIL